MNKKSNIIKRCGICGRFLSIDDFDWTNREKTTKNSKCSKCTRNYFTLWYETNIKEKKKVLKHIAKLKKIWRKNNGKLIKTYRKKFNKNNPEKLAAQGIKYRYNKENQTPELTKKNIALMKRIYKKSNELGVKWQVDHIIPLSKGGLHHPDNLQIIPKVENLKKGNKLDYIVNKSLIERVK